MAHSPSNLYQDKIEALAKDLGLDYYPVDFELAPGNFMNEIAVYGLPVRMPHWSFGVRYIHQLIRQSMGHSHIFEVMFPGDPCHAYLVNTNSLAENSLVTAHVLGHADFSKNNQLFARFHRMAGGHIVEQAAMRAHRIEEAIQEYGVERVETVMDAALALEPHVDLDTELHRQNYPLRAAPPTEGTPDEFHTRFQHLPGTAIPPEVEHKRLAPIPPHPEYDLLWFIAHYGPEMDDWEREIFLAVREESFYFYPVFACQIMNEGWASYWHARLLREADFLPQHLYLSAIKAHSDVVRPVASDKQTALSINPYHLGFSIWEDVVERKGIEFAREVMREEDDFGFVRNHLSRDLADKLGLFTYSARNDGEIRVTGREIHELREAILAPKFNFGSPRIAATHLHADGSLELTHDYQSDGRGLDQDRAVKVMQYIARVWRRPVTLQTVDEKGRPKELRSDPTKTH